MILVNGAAAEVLPIADRGLHYGDGLFETLAIRDDRALNWDLHLQRLQQGCNRLDIPCPDGRRLAAEASRIMRGISLGILKLIISRGSEGRGYRPPANSHPTRIMVRYPWPDYPGEHTQNGVVLRVCDTRLGRNPALAGIKHLNRLEQVLARAEWDDPDIQEGLMLDTDGRIIEGTMTNLFLVTETGLITPDVTDAGVAGVMRALVMELAGGIGLNVMEKAVYHEDLNSASELFICNSLIGLWPVKKIAGRHYPVGAVTRRLQTLLLNGGHVAK